MSNTEQKTYRATFILDTRHNDESVDEIVTRITLRLLVHSMVK